MVDKIIEILEESSRKRKLDDDSDEPLVVYKYTSSDNCTRTYFSYTHTGTPFSYTSDDGCFSFNFGSSSGRVKSCFSVDSVQRPAKRPRIEAQPKPPKKTKAIKQPKATKKPKAIKAEPRDGKDPPSAEEEEECPICYECYKSDDDKSFLPCAHYFHKHCVDQWLGIQNACPVCRTDPTGPPAALAPLDPLAQLDPLLPAQ